MSRLEELSAQRWFQVLQTEIRKTSISDLAHQLGYSRPTISLVLSGAYNGGTDRIAAKVTRRGMVPESLWMNFPPPIALHDYSHLGDNYRERERIKRKKARWAAKIEGMDRQERLAIMEVLETVK